MGDLVVENLYRKFGDVVAVDRISFQVHDGEFVTLLGPSGCGKSTTLFSIAGLQRPEGGIIRSGTMTLVDADHGLYTAPEKRNFGMVFQSYAVWPHMTVYENLAYPLKLRKTAKRDMDPKIRQALTLVEMQDYAARYPHELSGGQQQRVALARALVYSPSLLLLDEPLSNLDAKLRERARVWLKRLQKEVGITAIYVTHDQAEALTMSDRILVLDKGRICQDGTPEQVYTAPRDLFVADFIGSSSFLEGKVTSSDGSRLGIFVDKAQQAISAACQKPFPIGSSVIVAIRMEKIHLSSVPTPGADNCLQANVESRSYLGAKYQLGLRINKLYVSIETEEKIPGDTVLIHFSPEDSMVFSSPLNITGEEK